MDLQVFNYNEKVIRTSLNEKGETLFIAKDVCEILEIVNYRDAVEKLELDERDDVAITDTIGRQQRAIAVNESGLYGLIFTSRKPEAKKFRKWITSEVLPSIRKTGSYSAKSVNARSRQISPLKNAQEDFDVLYKMAKRFISDKNRALSHANSATEKSTGVNFQNLLGVQIEISNEDKLYTVGEISKEIGMSAKKFNSTLLEMGLIKKDPIKGWLVTREGERFVGTEIVSGKENSAQYPQLKAKMAALNEVKKYIDSKKDK